MIPKVQRPFKLKIEHAVHSVSCMTSSALLVNLLNDGFIIINACSLGDSVQYVLRKEIRTVYEPQITGEALEKLKNRFRKENNDNKTRR